MSEVSDVPLEELALLLQWEGWLSNARVREVCGVQAVRASVLIRQFREAHPKWLYHDTKTKAYYPTRAYFEHVRKQPSRRAYADNLVRYLALVGLPYATPVKPDHRYLVTAHTDLSTPFPLHFAALHAAARERRVVRIAYRSMTHPEAHFREISPHTVVRAGRRWHVRAFCDVAKDYRDFTLGRIAGVETLERTAERYVEHDIAWQTQVKVRLFPHPALTHMQAEVIRAEYMGGTAGLVETCRGALLKYFVQDARAAVSDAQQPPEYQLAVENVKEIEPWLFLK
ncbi:WYL domain-containing protein [Massilia niabensis]|uniref:WYL domain-containing protein n=1 Tax=Massilia niabensis TaxID=544910 RepID=A0ABW0L5V3_9BURK